MKHTVIALIAIGGVAGAVVSVSPVTGQSDGATAPIFGITLPEGYRDWRLIAVARLAVGKSDQTLVEAHMARPQLRAQLGNDIAIKAFRDGTLPFPDGAMIAALHWNEVSSAENDKVLVDRI
jgi:hypothetical protein